MEKTLQGEKRMTKPTQKPSGFVALCHCGKIIGAMDYQRTQPRDAGRVLGDWLVAGMTVKPMFGSSWSVNLEACACEDGTA
jgi:hypothetical protein